MWHASSAAFDGTQGTAPFLASRSLRIYYFVMSLAEIEKAVDRLSPDELAKLADYIARHDKLAWDKELERDSSPHGKHAAMLEKIGAEIDQGNYTQLP